MSTVSVHEFDPNTRDGTDPPLYHFASYCPERDPAWKAYTRRGHATSALSYWGIGSSWWWDGSAWKPLEVRVGHG